MLTPCRFVALVLLLLASPWVAALEEPDAVYGRFHRAVIAGEFEELLRYAPDAQKAELMALSASQRSAQVKMIASLMPRAYTLHGKDVAPDGQSARLAVSGAGSTLVGEKPETLYGSIRMVVLRGEWKVASAEWSPNQPAAPRPAARAGAAPAATASKAEAPPRPAGKSPVVGGLGSAPERKLGTQKPPCEFKPVMTAEDLENCR
jgi:hypothetical protein